MEQQWMDATCPCCGYKTISTLFEICRICAWEYDYTQFHPDDEGGANRIPLRVAQHNFISFGAKAENYQDMREPPTPEDRKDPDWQPFDPPAM